MFSRPSSPVLKARRESRKLCSSIFWSILHCLLVFCLSVWLFRLVFLKIGGHHRAVQGTQISVSSDLGLETPTRTHVPLEADLSAPSPSNATVHKHSSHPLSLAAILPVTSTSISHINMHLHSLLGVSDALVEIMILAPQAYHSQVRLALRNFLSNNEHLKVELSIARLLEGIDQGITVIQAAQRATTDWVLLLDEDGLLDMDAATRNLLLMKTMPSPTTFLPIGPRGIHYDFDPSCIISSLLTQSAAYLVPPFFLPTSILPSSPYSTSVRDPWKTLGDYVSRSKNGLGSTGGLVLGSSDSSSSAWCQRYVREDLRNSPPPVYRHIMDSAEDATQKTISTTETRPTGSGAVLLVVHSDDIRYIAPIACGFLGQGHDLVLMVSYDSETPNPPRIMQFEECRHAVFNHMSVLRTHLVDLKTLDELPARIPGDLDIVISAVEQENIVALVASLADRARSLHRSVSDIRIPREDLLFCDWMGTLTLEEWKSWHVPRIDLSVITDARPHSLRRLLLSLTRAKYFGDTLNLRINMEQTADPETLRMVNEFEWAHGNVFLHHRVVHGGLMAAVVESWYPHSNDSYALILEDDVELSPLFYAWAKMSLLRYRYGRPEDRSPNLFGISLYQQTNLELHPSGRHLFDARRAFAAAGLAHPSTPYLSQIPCSWGALYFPEHWREFHTYLPARLAALAWPLTAPVVPAVRSNRWARSWKKLFIELVFLRGYVMLYPNYAGLTSLSTNHLEAGSHVKDMPMQAYLRKKKLFNVPLMPLPPAVGDGGAPAPSTGLLELPDAHLPDWASLPVLDLLGAIVDEGTLALRGNERRTELTGCDDLSGQAFDVYDLLCMQ